MSRAWPGLLLCLTLLLPGCNHKSEPVESAADAPSPQERAVNGVVVIPQDSPKLRQIRVETIQTIEIPTDEVTAPGSLEVDPSRVSHVMLPVPGRVTAVMSKLGDAVEKGQALLAIESHETDTAESFYLQSESACAQARAAVAKAQADFDRESDLFAHDAVARKDVQAAENALLQAKGSLAQAEAAREQAVRRLQSFGLEPGSFGQKIQVRAPISGKILAVNVVAGEFRNDTNAPLMTVADLGTLWASSNVPEAYIRFCRVGGLVQVELIAFPGERFQARVTHIADTVDPQTRTIKVRAELNNSSRRFLPEMYGQIRYAEARKPTPVVDERSVFHTEGKNLVYVEQAPGRFQEREVALGKRVGDKLAIESGLQPGERVVVEGAIYLKGGV